LKETPDVKENPNDKNFMSGLSDTQLQTLLTNKPTTDFGIKMSKSANNQTKNGKNLKRVSFQLTNVKPIKRFIPSLMISEEDWDKMKGSPVKESGSVESPSKYIDNDSNRHISFKNIIKIR
jgi:hypothetical protein